MQVDQFRVQENQAQQQSEYVANTDDEELRKMGIDPDEAEILMTL